jgi:hypothetical protein
MRVTLACPSVVGGTRRRFAASAIHSASLRAAGGSADGGKESSISLGTATF